MFWVGFCDFRLVFEFYPRCRAVICELYVIDIDLISACFLDHYKNWLELVVAIESFDFLN